MISFVAKWHRSATSNPADPRQNKRFPVFPYFVTGYRNW